MDEKAKEALENAYKQFQRYRISNLTEASCFDYGPDPGELHGISKPLKEIPDHALRSMEFYEKGWNGWGTEAEVKYFLPRLLEYTADDLKRLESPGLFSLFKYKLADCLASDNTEWSEEEKKALLQWADSILEKEINAGPVPGIFIEALLCMGLKAKDILDMWSSLRRVDERDVKQALTHFDCFTDNLDFAQLEHGSGYYLDDRQKIKEFCTELLMRHLS